MAINYKCILAYGLTDEEFDKIQKRRIKVKRVTNSDASNKIIDILCGTEVENSEEELPVGEKALIFNGYNDKELRGVIKFIRGFIEGGVLAVVTEQSSKWTLKYLLEHLIKERTMYEEYKKGEK
ncbi:Conserved hypothetical protein, DUF3783 [Clostridium neonatale]|uniref:DUF3783 domain-containing protein n=1 Tax=Clostridium neonatale TaxID=137838 RepID=UPI001DDE7FFD|nr:DUF3783 domain-containing protein [Clostridium neonatale]CAG9702208.1 Conserved hypothetical protein, DUF3783 [Clostridium neonatale]